VIDSLAPGGAETSLAEMAPFLIADGVDLHVLPLGTRHDLAPRLEEAGAITHRRPYSAGRVGNVRAVLQVVKQVQPSLVHTTLFESDIAGRTAARLVGLRASTSLVVDSYGTSHYAQERRVKLAAAQAVDRVTARFATRIHAVSHTVAKSVAPRLGIKPEIVDVIPRGRDPHRFPYRTKETRAAVRASLGISDTTPVLLAVGRLEPQKGLNHLLHALPMVAEQHANCVILVAGRDGRSSSQLQAAALSLPFDVRFLGHRSDVSALLTAADVLCFPSEREGSPGTLLEALAVGCPVVASDIPTVKEVLGQNAHNVAVTLTPVGDAQRIAAAINSTLHEGDSLSPKLIQGRALFESRYSIEIVASQMTQFFRRAAGQEDRVAEGTAS